MGVHPWPQLGLGVVALVGWLQFGGVAWLLMLAAAVGWYVKARQSPRPSAAAVIYDGEGLPVVEWTEERRVFRSTGTQRVKRVRRRCSIRRVASDGTPFFVVESAFDDSGKFLPLGAVIGGDAIRAAKAALGVEKPLEVMKGCPWTALEAFVLTNDNEKFGSRDPDPDDIICADMGPEWGEAFVSISDAGRVALADLHRVLSREFIGRRTEHLVRLQRQAAPAPAAGAASRPSEL